MSEAHSVPSPAEQALRDSEARLRAIVETAVDGIITIDEHGIIEQVNTAAERIFGYTAQEMIGRNVRILMPNPYRDEHDQYLANYRRTGVPKIIGIGREVQGQKRDGTIFPIDLAVSEVQLGNRRIFTGIVRDITARKRAEEELRLAKEQAEAASRSKDQFLAMLSHELRTPLTPVLASMSFMEMVDDLPPELRQEVSAIRRNIETEARLIDDLLDVTRLNQGKLQLHFEAVDAHAVLHRALETVQPEVEEKELEILTSLRARQRHVWADPARLEQVFWNLLKNAVKFTPAGGSVRVQTSNNASGRLLVQVSDTGIGIEPEILQRIFNPFEQGEHSITRRFGGLGLGLAISRTLVEMQSGKLMASSEGRDKGATFAVELDVIPADTPRVAKPQPPRVADRKPLRILLVEDHRDTARIIAKLLSGLGHSVTTAGSVRDALKMANRELFDLLISDIGLPDGSGLDVMRTLKANQNLRGIAISGYGMEEDLRRSREAGFELHLTKPINFQALDSVLQKLS